MAESPHNISRRVTSIEVAKAASVSQSTVSRVFSGGKVSPKAKARVLTAAKSLGYRPSAIARSLSTQRTGIVGIVMADIASPFYPYVLEKFTEKLQAIGLRILLFNAPPHRDVDDTLPLVFQYQVDAIVITSATLSSAMADECAQLGIPVVLFNRYGPNKNAGSVCCDNLMGGRLVADYLLDSGHQRLAYVAGQANTSTNRDRERGFRERLAERGISTWQREQGEYTYEDSYRAVQRLLRLPEPPDALFCANDIMALGAIDAARDMGVSIPAVLSVIGFDDIPAAAWSAYNLTTIRQPVNGMVDAAVEMVRRQLADPTVESETLFMSGELVQRGTVGEKVKQ